MFYEKGLDKVLRFGDVVRGYVSINSSIKRPFLSSKIEGYDYKIDIEMPSFSVVLTPCCSIGEGVISLTPLIPVLGDFFKNPYFEEDLTNINRIMEPEQRLPPSTSAKLTPEEKESLENQGKEYALLNFFIYEENEIFVEYTLKGHKIKYYMIDFRNAHKVKCGMIKRPEKLTPDDEPIIESKVLQLTVEARKELRDKIANYYARTPEEDKILED